MKITYIHQYFATPQSNGGIRSYEMAKRLVEQGHEVNVITTSAFLPSPEKYSEQWNLDSIDGIKLHIYKLPYSNNIPFWKRIIIFLTFCLKSTLYARSIKTDIVFATSTPLTIAIPGVLSARKNKVPFIFEVRDLWPDVPIALGILKNPISQFLAKSLEKWAYKNASHIIALSPGMAEGVKKSSANSKVSIIPNASDLELFSVDDKLGLAYRKKHDWLGDRPLCVYTGTFGKVNNLSYIVNVAKETLSLNPEVRFALIGTGAQFELLKEKSLDNGTFNKNLFFLPPVPKSELPQILNAADISISTVLPIKELWHNSANKFFDALAASRPIAINHYGWQADLIENQQVGLVMPPDSPKDAAIALNSYLSDRSKMQQLQRNSLELAQNEFSRDLLFEKFSQVIEVQLSNQLR